jgi:hypothetical protein
MENPVGGGSWEGCERTVLTLETQCERAGKVSLPEGCWLSTDVLWFSTVEPSVFLLPDN